MGNSIANVAEVDFALIGHQESWRAAADVLAVLRGPERTPLPDDEIRDILPWIPPRPVCHVEIASVIGTKAHGLYIDSFIPPDRLDRRPSARQHGARSGSGSLCHRSGRKDRESRRFQFHPYRRQFQSAPGEEEYGLHHRQYLDRWFHRPGRQQDVCARGRNLRQIHAAHSGSNRRRWIWLRPLLWRVE